MELLLCDRLVHVTFEAEDFVRDSVEASCRWHLTLILESDRQDAFTTDASLLELEHRSTISLKSIRLLNLQSRQSTLTT